MTLPDYDGGYIEARDLDLIEVVPDEEVAEAVLLDKIGR